MITKKEFSQALTDNASVAAGLIPTASLTNSGLMSSDLYKYSVKCLLVRGTQMIKLYTKTNSNWVRKGGLVSFSNEYNNNLYLFCVVEIINKPTRFKVSRVYGDNSTIKFYQKDSELYMYYDSIIDDNISVSGFSSGNIEFFNGELDETFTEVEIS